MGVALIRNHLRNLYWHVEATVHEKAPTLHTTQLNLVPRYFSLEKVPANEVGHSFTCITYHKQLDAL